MEQIDATESYMRRNKILEIFNEKGPISFNDLKEEYERKAGETFPFVGDNATIQQLFLEFGIQYDYKLDKYYVKKEYNFRKSSIFHGTPYAKRSRSAPFKEDDEEDVEEIRKSLINIGASSNKNQRQSRNTRVKENNNQKKKVNTEPRSKSEFRSPLLGKPHVCGTIIIADDFFLGITTKHLNFKAFKQDGVLQSGFCVSGLTIAAAKKMVDETICDDRYKTALIYLGSIDIIQDKYLINIMQEYTDFLALCIKKKIHPVLCTLAPMPNLELIGDRLEVFNAFNVFIRANKFNMSVLDIYACFVKPKTFEYIENYYQNTSHITSGCEKPLVIWSNEGSKRVFDFVMKNLGFALVAEQGRVFNFM
ncbi:hypothetical protein PVAND_013388 [Polypedilum vanderplanki]|uniref:OSK domain-containing protein n=1 Tax=Polypedilum vanderplanki TaxID=319348 RepID=A0A9J6CRE5_POLVA|nr:hypothetical protein PVAND_013388 [Polypedilum vanderplanki]